MMLQSALLGLGAYLTIRASCPPGAIIASSIVTARALAPVDLAIAQLEGRRRRAAQRSSALSARRWPC